MDQRGRKRRETWWTRLSAGAQRSVKALAAIVGILVGISTILGFLLLNKLPPFSGPSQAELAESYDDTNPARACAHESAVVATIDSGSIVNGSGDVIATLEVRHSASCGTTWVRVVSAIADVVVVKSVQRAETDNLTGETVSTSDRVVPGDDDSYLSWSQQLYAPECVVFTVEIESHDGTILGAFGPKAAC